MKKTPLIAVTAAAGLVLAACSGGETTTDGSTDAGSGGETTAMTWTMWIGSTEDQDAWQAVADTVAAENPGISLTIQGAPWGDYWTKLTTQITSSDAPCVISIQSLRAAQFTEGLVPLDDLISAAGLDLAEFDQGALNNLKVDGTQYALPYDTGPAVIFYNADMFDAAGLDTPAPGWSVADFEAAAAALKDSGVTAYANTAEDMFLEGIARSYNGSSPIADDGTVQADDPGFVETVDWVGGLVTQGFATQADGADGSADDNVFMTGGAAMLVNGPWAMIDLGSKVDFTMGVTTLPTGDGGGDTVSAGSGFGISKSCETPDEAFAAITTMTGDAVLTSLAEQGRAFPARTAAQPSWMTNAESVIQVADTMAYAQEHSVPAPGSAQAEQMQQLFAQYLPQALNGDKPAAEVLGTVQSQIG